MQVTEHVHAVKIPFQVTGPNGLRIDRFVYVYLIYGKKICLIDSGVASSESVIFDYIMKTGRKPEEISTLVLTHSHPDHIGAAQAIKRVSGCIIAAHAAEKPWIEDVDRQSRERPVPKFHDLVEGSVGVDRVLEEGDGLELGDGLRLEVLHTPGHSQGSISLFHPEEGVLFSGDAIPLAGDIPIYENALASVRSIKRLKAVEGIDVLLASWDQPRKGDEVYQTMDEGLRYLQRIHKVVIEVAGGDIPHDSSKLCKEVLAKLGLPEMVANPLVTRSLEANLEVRDRQDLLQG